MFGAFVEVYSRLSGFKPISPRIEKVLRPASLKLGIAVGCSAILVGVLGTLSSVLDWREQGVVYMDPEVGLRKVIPSTTLTFIGIQGIVSSFFMGVLK